MKVENIVFGPLKGEVIRLKILVRWSNLIRQPATAVIVYALAREGEVLNGWGDITSPMMVVIRVCGVKKS